MLALVGSQAHTRELGNLIVKVTANGAPVRRRRSGDGPAGNLPVYTIVSANGKPAVLLNIARQPSSNTVAVADGVAARSRNCVPSCPRA